MLIQCQSCTHKFRLNLERLPARKTFVRCKNCGTPIYIHGEEEAPAPASGLPEAVTVPESLANSPVIPPWLAGMPVPEAEDDTVLVTCPQCDSRYRMPREPLRNPDLKLKCTHCEYVFVPPQELLVAPGPGLTPAQVARATMQEGGGYSAVIPPSQVIPEPDEARMTSLFDDMAPEPGIRRPPPREPADADEAYLEAVDLGEDIPRPAQGTVPDAQRYSLFLKSGELPAHEEPAAAPPPEPAPEPPPEPELEVDEAAAQAVFEESGLPPLQEAPLPPLEAAPAPAPEPALPPLEEAPLPALVIEPPRKPPTKQVLPDQDRWLTPRQRYAVLGAVAAVVLLVAGLWAAWLWMSPGGSQPYTIETGRVHQLALEDSLEGRYTLNKPSGKRLFIVQGYVENHFPPGTEISWIRLRGAAYSDRNQTRMLGTAYAFIGNVLTDKQLGAWELDAILAYSAYNNGRDNANYRIPPGGRVPFQLVFPGIAGTVGRTVAQVVSYHRNNLAVYVDPGR